MSDLVYVFAHGEGQGGIVHLAERRADKTLCEARRLPVPLSRRAITCDACKALKPSLLGGKEVDSSGSRGGE